MSLVFMTDNASGYRVLRSWNNNVTNDIDGVLKVIWSARRDGFFPESG